MKSKFFTLLYLFMLSFTTIFAQSPSTYFSNWTMTFPPDVVLNCGNENDIPPPLIKQQIIQNNGDDLWGMEVKADTFDISGVDGTGACFKIVRTYIFINWDTWNINNTELAIVNRPHDLILTDADRVVFRHRSTDLGINIFGDEDDIDPYDEQINADDDGALVILEDVSSSDADLFPRAFIENINGNFVTSAYAENYGYFAYRQIIKIADHDAPVVSPIADLSFCDTLGSCSADVFLPAPTVQECSSFYTVTYTMTNNETGNVFAHGRFPGDAPFDTIFISEAPLENYTVRYIVEDGCSNFSAINYQIEVNDCLAPTTYCINGLAVNLSANGTAVLWASDFDAGSYDACNEPISLSFSPDLDSTSVLYECENVGVNIVKLYATDAVGNYTYCSTFVVVQPNSTSECDASSGFSQIIGHIRTEQLEAIEGVKVMVNNLTGIDTLVTSEEGSFIPYPIYLGYDYTFSPQKNTEHSNGITVYDLILLRKHIIGLSLLNSPYKMIAADVNRDDAITMMDVIELMKIMTGQQTEFNNNNSWRFVASNYQFPNTYNPWYEPFPEVTSYNNLSEEDDIDFNFIGVKIGDLNLSANTNNINEVEDRNEAGTVILHTEDLSLEVGKTYQIPFYVKNLSTLSGFQTTLQFHPEEVELLSIEEGAISAHQWNWEEGKNGNLPFIYVGAHADEEVLFYLNIKAKTAAHLSDLFDLNTNKEHTEAYNQQMEQLNMTLDFDADQSTSLLELYQNKPNPFSQQTDISFYLSEASTVILSIYNTQQQLIFQSQPNLLAGTHVLPFNSEQLSNGIYYYTLQAKNEIQTRKMVVVK